MKPYTQALVFIAPLLLIASCENPSSSVVTTAQDVSANTSVVANSAAAPEKTTVGDLAITAGDYCFEATTSTLSALAQLEVKENGQVQGSTDATIQNPTENYYSSYSQTFEGSLSNDRLRLQVVTQIENDTQQAQETWTLTDNSLNTGREVYSRVECSTLDAETSSLEMETDVETSSESEKESIASAPQANRPTRIQFRRGANSAVVEGAVVRGTRNIYLLGARRGQQMLLDITSLENNAVFDLVAPNGRIIQQEVTTAEVTLPATGDYQVIVGGTRGNATYELRAQIR